MTNNEIDTILHNQLVIARLGEKELMNWWNTDIAYEMGGGDFLERLLGKTMAPLAAGEGILRAAFLRESQVIKDMPNNQNVYTLFKPEPEVEIRLEERLRHFKRYPDSVPENIAGILDPKTEWTPATLAALIPDEKTPECSATSFGKEIKYPEGQNLAEVMTGMAALIRTNEKSRYVMAFYRKG